MESVKLLAKVAHTRARASAARICLPRLRPFVLWSLWREVHPCETPPYAFFSFLLLPLPTLRVRWTRSKRVQSTCVSCFTKVTCWYLTNFADTQLITAFSLKFESRVNYSGEKLIQHWLNLCFFPIMQAISNPLC